MNLKSILLALLLPFGAAYAQDRGAVEAQFQAWLINTVLPKAQANGVSQTTFDAAFNGVTLNWDLPDLVPPGTTAQPTQSQAEFGAPGRYFARGSIDSATSIGREMAQRHATALATTESATGVPGAIILAIWGRESSYGRAAIPHNAFEVLGTKGFMSTRADYFTGELIAALQIAERGDVPADQLRSSWAGALGQPQFMPSNYLTYARDGDGDGRADIWGSEADTIASIGHYLSAHGWRRGRDWGFEVTRAHDMHCVMEGPDRGQPIYGWEDRAFTRVGGRDFPANERPESGYLMQPAGNNGPSFVVTDNFYVLKDYNESDVYALFVGHVADRIQFGVGDFTGAWGGVDTISRADITTMQLALESLGHDVGGADGLVGYKTRRSIGSWQINNDRAPTCFPDAQTVAAIIAAGH